jgi:hypothetical protein
MRSDEQELGRDVRRELEALDRALSGEPVDAELDAVATLARDLRASRPEPTTDFAGRLDERVADGFASEEGGPSPFAVRVREWMAGARPARVIAPAAAMATVVLVASVALLQSGGGGDATSPVVEDIAPEQEPGDLGRGAEAAPSTGADGESAAAAPEPDTLDEIPPTATTVPTPPTDDRERVAPGSDREVESSASLSLSADGDEFEEVADGVVEITDRYKGFVVSSDESTSGETSRASFELEIPSDRLSEALADLSELAHVEARTEETLDITAPTVTARQRLTDARAEVDALLGQLADADTPKETVRIRDRLAIARAEVAAAKEELQQLARRANYSDVRVTVTSDGGGDGEWGADDAVEDIGDALSTVGGITLIAAAILLPLGLAVALAVFASRRSVRRGRERALGD